AHRPVLDLRVGQSSIHPIRHGPARPGHDDYLKTIEKRTGKPPMTGQPMECPIRKVEKQWVDLNGHMNMAYYHLVFDESLDVAFSALGIGWDYTQKGEGSCFTAEVHVCYLDEVKEGDPLR